MKWVPGSTAGAVAMGLRVVARRSQRLSLPVELLRAIGCVVFPIGLMWVMVDRAPKIVAGHRLPHAGGLLAATGRVTSQQGTSLRSTNARSINCHSTVRVGGRATASGPASCRKAS